jgi:glycerate dehydrogenase
MKTVVLDGYCLNPGDLSWEALREVGELVVRDRTPAAHARGFTKQCRLSRRGSGPCDKVTVEERQQNLLWIDPFAVSEKA